MSVIKVGENKYVGNDVDKFAIAKPATLFFSIDAPKIYVYGHDGKPVTIDGTLSDPPLTGYTVGTLPAGTQGDKAFVTDALAPTWNATAVGGGAVVVPVFYNGTNWVTV